MSLKLISFKTCPYVQRSVIVLKEKGIPFDITYIDLKNKPDWFLKLSPRGLVPVLCVDDEPLFESAVINEYLDETNPPPLHPADPLLRARNRAWIAINGDLNVSHFGLYNVKTREEFEQKRQTAHEILSRVDSQLRQRPEPGPWFNGPAFSLVDATYAPFFMRLSFLEQWFDLQLLDDLAEVQTWAQSLLARESVQQSVLPEFPELYRTAIRSAGSYLSSRLPA